MRILIAATASILLLLVSMPAPAAPAEAAPALAWEVISRRAHDPEAFTQGLQLDGRGRLFESTGLRGRSTLREVDAATGAVLRSVALPERHFGEGLALAGDRLIQLTWQSGVATARDIDSFEPLESFEYDGEGWGLCFDGERLVMSDGSDRLTFRDPGTFEALGEVDVTLDSSPLRRLNELECVEGRVWANVWMQDIVVRIDPADGRVSGVLDLAGIIDPPPSSQDSDAVLNGITYDEATETWLVTGKLWPELIEIRVSEAGEPGGTRGAGEAMETRG